MQWFWPTVVIPSRLHIFHQQTILFLCRREKRSEVRMMQVSRELISLILRPVSIRLNGLLPQSLKDPTALSYYTIKIQEMKFFGFRNHDMLLRTAVFLWVRSGTIQISVSELKLLKQECTKKERKKSTVCVNILHGEHIRWDPIFIFPYEAAKWQLARKHSVEFFLNNTNPTFLAVLYKIDIEGFQNQQK